MELDMTLFHEANRLVSYSWWTFYRAVDIDEPTWVLAAMALVAMWFAGQTPTQADYIQNLGKQPKKQATIRSHVIVLFVAMALSFVLARGLQHFFPQPRPMAVAEMIVPIDAADWQQIKAAISTQGAFPSDHAVMWFVMATGVFWLSRKAGLVAFTLAIVCSIMRVGAGYHWPRDMAAGAALGIGMTLLSFAALKRVPSCSKLLAWIVALFDRYPVWLYTIAFAVVWDFSQKFSTLFAVLAMVLGHSVSH